MADSRDCMYYVSYDPEVHCDHRRCVNCGRQAAQCDYELNFYDDADWTCLSTIIAWREFCRPCSEEVTDETDCADSESLNSTQGDIDDAVLDLELDENGDPYDEE